MTLLSWKSILFQLLLTGGGLLVFGAGAAARNASRRLLFILTTVTILSATLAALLINGGTAPFSGMLDTGLYARFFNALFALTALMTLFFSHRHAGLQPVAGDEFYGLLIFAVLGMSLIAGATHWLIFFLGFELLSLAFYVLIAFCRNEPGYEAALKYLVMGMVASGFLAFGIAMLYSATGSLQMAVSLGATVKSGGSPAALLALGLILTAVGFKVSLVPFHLWTPDVYQGAPAPVTAFLTTGSKIAVFAGLLRILLLTSGWLWAHCIPVLWILAAATMLAGNIAALTQTRLKRLLAYSSIAQMGYAAMGLLAIKSDGGLAVIFYMTAYALMDMGAFGVIATCCTSEDADMDDLNQYQGFGYSHPWQGAILTVCLLSLAGLPPTAGFMGKFFIFKDVFQTQYTGLAILGIVAAILSLFVYLKVVVTLYMRSSEETSVSGFGMAARCAFAVIVFGVLWLGLFPSFWLTAISRMTAL